jgi:hypothetical protein
MYGSYGSYSSMSASITAPIDITGGALTSRDAPCAFPSWPRRSSLDREDQERPTSFLSDDDLAFLADPFEDDARSISSGASSSSSSPAHVPVHQFTDATAMEMERERLAALQRDYIRHMIGEKERKRQVKRAQAQRKAHAHMSSRKSSPKSKLNAMTPITEAKE